MTGPFLDGNKAAVPSMDWMEKARCASLTDHQKTWFQSEDAAEREAAKNVCKFSCTVRTPCLAFGRTIGFGVWGGQELGRPGRPPLPSVCGEDAGTRDGIEAHFLARSKPCIACRDYRRERRNHRATIVARNDAIRALIADGLTNNAIITALGVGGQTVQRLRDTA